MQLSKIFILGSVVTCFSLGAFAADKTMMKEGSKAAKSDQTEEASLEMVTCWEIMTLPEKDRDFALVLLYGYSAGKHNDAIQSSEKISKRIASAGDKCGQKPDMKAIDVFQGTK